MLRTLARVFAGLAALLLIAGGVVLYVYVQFSSPGSLDEDTVVDIPRGSGLLSIAERLAETNVIDDPWVFRGGVMMHRHERDLKAGEYAFPAGVSARGAMDILLGGQSITYSITVPEGLTSVEVVALIQADPILTGEVEVVPPQGSLLPETYSFQRGDSRPDLIARMSQAMDRTLAEAWQERNADLPLESPEEVLILASIIEKETGVDAERAQVAGVFVNRLRLGMPLQTDPTVIYALTNGEAPLGRALLRADLEVESPYNTYRVRGLPPGPIANPGAASIRAAVNPAETDYLYFVADGTGGHAFAETLDEHNRNVARWRQINSNN